LAAQAAATSGDLDDYDLALDIPFYYVDADGNALLEERIARVETHRCYAQWRWLRMFPPRPPKLPPSVERVVTLERGILHEMFQPTELLPNVPNSS
jgi:hypothetical protein